MNNWRCGVCGSRDMVTVAIITVVFSNGKVLQRAGCEYCQHLAPFLADMYGGTAVVGAPFTEQEVYPETVVAESYEQVN